MPLSWKATFKQFVPNSQHKFIQYQGNTMPTSNQTFAIPPLHDALHLTPLSKADHPSSLILDLLNLLHRLLR